MFSDRERARLVVGYFLGFSAGLAALGLRFFPVISPSFFFVPGGCALVVAAGWICWPTRQANYDQLFP